MMFRRSHKLIAQNELTVLNLPNNCWKALNNHPAIEKAQTYRKKVLRSFILPPLADGSTQVNLRFMILC